MDVEGARLHAADCNSGTSARFNGRLTLRPYRIGRQSHYELTWPY